MTESPDAATPDNDRRRSLLQRGGTLLVVLIVHILGVIGLIMLAPEYLLPPKKPEPTVFTLADPADRAKAKSTPRSKAQTKTAKPATPAPPQLEEKTPPPLAMVMLDSHVFASTNIGALPQSAAAAPPADDGGAPGGKGAGPNGERLYNAEWYREPTEAETGPYFRGVRSVGWGEIACRTIDHWHVEDCRELDESPPGSGIARAARQAAWQFLVRPPRIGGKLLIGSWVRIRYTITPAKASDAQR